MQIRFERVNTLPKLAWCAEVRRDQAELYHGPWVETRPGMFCEGAWNGDFSAGDFDTSVLVGSAGKAANGGLLFSTANNTVERIYLLQLEDAVLASNSLVFLLARTNDELMTSDLFCSARLGSIILGLKKCVRHIPTRKGRRIRLCYHSNISIGPDLRVTERPKKPTQDFENYTQYKSYLEATVAGIVANASDPSRLLRYRPITTLSSGYDSPAVAVLAMGAGCTEALTIRQARPSPVASSRIMRRFVRPRSDDDSGEDIARILGLDVTAQDRMAYIDDPDFTEAENGGTPLPLGALGTHLEGRLLFTGFHGDKVWDRNALVVGTDIVRGDSSGSGFAEFRLRAGFLHLPVPFIGVTSHPSIYRISNSAEMRPWTLFSAYDRPIPRRIVEEAGVPREMFGRSKKAVEAVVRREGLEALMKPESLQDFKKFSEDNWTLWTAFKAGALRPIKNVSELNHGVSRRLFILSKHRLGINLRLPILVPRWLRVKTCGHVGRESLLFHWAATKLLPRYQVNGPFGVGASEARKLREIDALAERRTAHCKPTPIHHQVFSSTKGHAQHKKPH